jgi:uncharacterized protein (TIGR03437 family)
MLIQFEKLSSVPGGFHMRLRAFVLFFAGLLGCAALKAQTPPQLPSCLDSGTSVGCSVGSSFSIDFGQLFDLPMLVSEVAAAGGTLTYSFEITSGSLPPGLTLTTSGLLSGVFTQAGEFDATATISFTVMGNGVTFTESFPFPLVLFVSGYSGPQLTVDPLGLNFNLTQNAAPATQSVTLTNHGSTALAFSASASTNSGGNWLALSGGSGSVPAFGTSSLGVTADPSQLTAGTYSGSVTVSAGGQVSTVSVVAVVTGSQPTLSLSQTGVTFSAVSGGTATSPQTIAVLNQGAGTLSFSASTSTISGGSWLNISPSSGSSSASSSGSVTVSVNPAGLQPGTYYGKVSFSSTTATNSAQIASVVLNVVSPANSPGASALPTGLIFVGTFGGTDPAPKTVSITNPSPNALTYDATPFSNNATNWLSITPTSGSVSATQSGSLSVQPSLQGLQPGFYIGDLVVTFLPASATSTAPPQIFHIEVLLLVLGSGGSSAARPALRPRATTCTPTQLLPVFTLLGTGFSVNAGWPTAIEVTVVDDCGNPLLTGSVTVTFSSGDPALSLTSLNDGRWTSTWNPTNASSSVTITAQAQEIQPALTGKASIGGAAQPNTSTPSFPSNGVVVVFSTTGSQPIAPGAIASIYGSNLGESGIPTSQLPFMPQLGSTSVFLGSEAVPLQYAGPNQVNVVVPYDVPVNSTQQLVVQNGSAISVPQSVVIAPAQPAVFNTNGVAFYAVYKPDGTTAPNNSPVTAGDVIVLYCSSLGAVDHPIVAGTQTPASPLFNTVNPVTVTIGGVPMTADFAGLVYGFAQLYQVNATIPKGLPSGTAVLTLSVAGQQSAPVTIAIQ